MKRATLFLAIGSILAAVTLCVAATAPNSNASEIDQLKRQIETLTQRVDSLERRLYEDRTFTIPRVRPLPQTPPDPNALPGFRSTPRDWRRFEFNGMPYYVIPIDAGSVVLPEPKN